MRFLLLNSFAISDTLARYSSISNWFEDEDIPSEFDVLFSKNQNIYQYGFSILCDKIVEEYLYVRDSKQKKEKYHELILRDDKGFSGMLLEEIGKDNILKLVDEHTLFISVLSKFKIDSINDVVRWFMESSVSDYGNPAREHIQYRRVENIQGQPESPLIKLIEDKKEKKLLENFLQAIDVGIAGIDVITTSFPDETEERKS